MSRLPTPPPDPTRSAAGGARVAEIGRVFLRLGLTSFGGPVAHLGYFRTEFVERRRWLTDAAYAELVALCQFLPGPTSSQVGLAVGLQRGGWLGALVAWAGFTLPSAILLVLLALGLARMNWYNLPALGALHGLKLAAVAVVAHAVWGMARSLCPDAPRRVLALGATGLALWWSGPMSQVGLIALAALLGALAGGSSTAQVEPAPMADAPRATASEHAGLRRGMLWLLLFTALLVGLPLWARVSGNATAELLAVFYRAGALVFGGGHVVLPLLQAEVVPRGWLELDGFLAGYGAAQAVPGPLFTFAAFVGAARDIAPHGWLGGLLALVAIFLPGFLLLFAALPVWARLRHLPWARRVLATVNAAVVGLLLATWLGLLGPSISSVPEAVIALLATLVLWHGRVPAWAVALSCALAGSALAVAR
ncbi:chromate efflux transporter [Ottowia sp. GY511]|uniref:Chromate efflux transporter n=1 Tax=Ottowia flava TaxID=2675430 RepID=A0ABW4KMT0_9BURK|nr:chromate efflux transporter [Ottowia sp. GY511]TXK29518.1 chromate efflux transporter [Ottowia sp. GY511]